MARLHEPSEVLKCEKRLEDIELSLVKVKYFYVKIFVGKLHGARPFGKRCSIRAGPVAFFDLATSKGVGLRLCLPSKGWALKIGQEPRQVDQFAR